MVFRENKGIRTKSSQVFIRVIFFSLTSFIVSFYLMMDPHCPSGYSTLFVLPAVFGVVSFLFNRVINQTKYSQATLLIVILYYIRYVISPLVLALGNYSSYVNVNSIGRAVGLMCYEIFFVFLILYLLYGRMTNLTYSNDMDIVEYDFSEMVGNTHLTFHIIVFFIIVFMIIVIARYPSALNMYTSLFGSETLVTESISSIADRGANRAFLTLFSLLFNIIRIIIPTYLCIEIKRRISNDLFALFLSLPIIIIQFVFIGGTAAYTIFCVFVNLFVLMRLYPRYKRGMLRITYILIMFSIIIFFLMKLSYTVLYTGGSWVSLSKMLQAYFPGVTNLQCVFKMVSDNKLSNLFYDIYYAIPFNTTLFGLTGVTSANVFNSSNSMRFQIIPCIGQSYYYVGFFFAPVLSSMFCYYSVKTEFKTKNEKSIWMFMAKTLLWLYLAATPAMYNFHIFLVRFMDTIIPCLILAWFAKDQLLKNI